MAAIRFTRLRDEVEAGDELASVEFPLTVYRLIMEAGRRFPARGGRDFADLRECPLPATGQ